MPSGNITTANVSSTIPLTAGSYVSIQNGPAVGSVTFQVSGTYTGQLAVYTCLDGTNPIQVNSASIVNANTGATGISANATGLYTIDVPAGTVYVYASAWTNGTTTVTLSAGLASGANPGSPGGGESVNITAINGAAPGSTNPLYVAGSYGTPGTATWTSATNTSAFIPVTLNGAASVAITAVISGTVTGGTIGFQVYDGANWVNVQASRTTSTTTDLQYALAGGTQAWQSCVSSFQQFRVTLPSAIVGSGNVLITIIPSALPVVNPAVSSPKWTLSPNSQGVNALQVKASAGTLGAFQAYSRAASVSYIFVYDSLSASGTLIDVFPLYANGAQEIGSEYFGQAGYDFATGIYLAISTSNTSYVAGTAANYDIGAKAK